MFMKHAGAFQLYVKHADVHIDDIYIFCLWSGGFEHHGVKGKVSRCFLLFLR